MLFALSLIACNTDVSITEEANEPPNASIQSPTGDTVFAAGQVIDLVGVAADPNGDHDIAAVLWNSSLDGELGNPTLASPDAEGFTRVSAVLSAGTHAITLTVTDQAGLTATESITLTLTEDSPMTAEILSPEPFEGFLSGSPVSLDGLVTAQHQDVETLEVVWSIEDADDASNAWELTRGAPSETGSAVAEWTDSQPGNWLIVLSVIDEIDNSTQDEVYIVVGDTGNLDQDGDGATPNEGDCDDYDASVSHLEDEVCGDGKDNDCSGMVDDKDLDGDAHIDEDCTDYSGQLPADDCDDDNAAVNPDESDAPDLAYLDENCDGLDGDEADSIFVDPTGGNDSANGTTPQTAVRTLDKAFTRASQNNADWVLIAGNSVTLSGNFEDGVSLAGGYDATDWSRSGADVPLIALDADGRKLKNWNDSTEWQQLEISSANADDGDGDSSIVLTLDNSTGLYLNDVTVVAGNGGDGADGGGGGDGSDGGDGAKGTNGCEDSFGLCSSCNQPTAGSGGSSSCSSGGKGGSPGHNTSSGSAGSTGSGSNGGGGGGGQENVRRPRMVGAEAFATNAERLAYRSGLRAAQAAMGSQGAQGASPGAGAKRQRTDDTPPPGEEIQRVRTYLFLEKSKKCEILLQEQDGHTWSAV